MEQTLLKGIETAYIYTMTTSYFEQIYLELFRYMPETTTNFQQSYWIASRCFTFNDLAVAFRIFFVGVGMIQSNGLYSSDNGYSAWPCAIRPIVEIDLSKVNVGLTGDGGADTPYSIEAK